MMAASSAGGQPVHALAASAVGLTYRALIHGLKKGGIEIDRKVLADMAMRDPQGFGAIADMVKAQAAA